MEKLKIAYVDMWYPWESEDFITPILKQRYDVVEDKNDPDIVFHSVFNGLKDSKTYKCKKVVIIAENHRPHQFGANYSISFDKRTDTNFRLPLWQIFCLLNPDLFRRLVHRQNHNIKDFKKFASFTVSNPSNGLRNAHFDALNSFQPVSSYGKVRTNSLKLQQFSQGKHWREAKDEFFMATPHKFMMAYENSSYPYYCTEKLMDAFLVGSMPIYWGDPKVKEDWNSRAFINVLNNDFMNDVKRFHENDDAFLEMYREPVFTGEQKDRHLNNMHEFEEWLLRITKE